MFGSVRVFIETSCRRKVETLSRLHTTGYQTMQSRPLINMPQAEIINIHKLSRRQEPTKR